MRTRMMKSQFSTENSGRSPDLWGWKCKSSPELRSGNEERKIKKIGHLTVQRARVCVSLDTKGNGQLTLFEPSEGECSALWPLVKGQDYCRGEKILWIKRSDLIEVCLSKTDKLAWRDEGLRRERPRNIGVRQNDYEKQTRPAFPEESALDDHK